MPKRQTSRKRPCCICRKWFEPQPRIKSRQRTCGRPACQKERHRKSCAQWRKQNPNYDRDGRLRTRLIKSEVLTGDAAQSVSPLQRVDWEVAQKIIGLDMAVLLEEALRVLHQWAQAEIRVQLYENKGKTTQLSTLKAQDTLDPQPPENKEETTRLSTFSTKDEIAQIPKPP
jgi:hypothetical protein